MEGISDGYIIAFTSLPVQDAPSHDTVLRVISVCGCLLGFALSEKSPAHLSGEALCVSFIHM